jgi:sugar/nucleoside kinase (ribokinase family)
MMTDKKYDAFIAGYTCVDLIPAFKKNDVSDNINDILKPGKLIEIEGLDFVLGGLVPNTGLAMKKFGKNVYLNGLLGKDIIGRIALEKFRDYGIREGILSVDHAGTAYSLVLAPPGVDRIFLESPGCNQIFDINHIDFKKAGISKLFHFGYPPLLKQFIENDGDQLINMYSKVQKMGVITSLDLSLPDTASVSGRVNWPEIMKSTLPCVDIFVPSIEELLAVIAPGKYKELTDRAAGKDLIDIIPVSLIRETGEAIIGYGVKILMIKMGKNGAYLITGNGSSVINNSRSHDNWDNREILCNAYTADPSRVKNASGAGDTAVAAFLSAVLDGVSPEEAVKYATAAGRDKLYCDDIYRDIPEWNCLSEEISREINEPVVLK